MSPAWFTMILASATLLCGVVCGAGYLASYAMVRRLHPDGLRPVIRPQDLLRPIGGGVLIGVVILASQSAVLQHGATSAMLWFLLLISGFAGICAGSRSARRVGGGLAISAGDLVRRLCIAGDSHDDATARIAVKLALAAGYDPAGASDLMAAAALHDIGKTGLPGTILGSPDGLDPEAERQQREHTRLGYRMLARSDEPMLDLAADIALHHHEHWDGSGYPSGFAEQQIPFTSRVVAVAARLDDLVRANSTTETIEAAMRGAAGSQFDPTLVDLLLDDLPAMVFARNSAGPAPAPVAQTARAAATWTDPVYVRALQPGVAPLSA